VRIRTIVIGGAALSLCLVSTVIALAQQASPTEMTVEQRIPLSEAAVALDGKGSAALEGNLRTTALNGAPDTPVTNTRIVIKNVSPLSYSYVSGVVTFYDGSGIRCAEGIFKADAVAVNESVEADSPGIRIRCAPATWRIVATNLLPRLSPGLSAVELVARPTNLVISVDGEEYPIQLDKPMVLNLGEKQRTIVVRQVP
jgi:hypothetical protein